MSTDLDLRFEKLTPATVGVRLFVEEKLFKAYQINAYRQASIDRVVEQIAEVLGQTLDSDALAGQILSGAMAVLHADDDGAQPEARRDPLDDTPQETKDAAIALLNHPDLLMESVQAVQDLGVAGEEEMIAALILTGTSRLLSRPLATVTTGASSSGKSYVLEKTSQLFPEEAKFEVTSSSSKSFFYLPEGSLRHRWVIMGEQARTTSDESEDVKRTLREMLSAGKISRAVSLASNGQIETKIFVQEGPIAYSDSTTLTKQFAEDVNRTIVLHPDESAEQTRAILKRTAAQHVGGGLSREERQRLIELHHTAQRLLEPLFVVIPYSDLLADSLAVSNVEMRRGLPLFLSAIEACALYHQFQRDRDEAGRVIATSQDYAIVVELLSSWLVENMAGGVNKTTHEFYQWLLSEFGANTDITVPACTQKGKSAGQARYQLDKLGQAGLVTLANGSGGGRGRSNVFRLVVGDQAQRSVGLPSVDEVKAHPGASAS